MAATYFSSRERRTDSGLGRLDTFREDSTSFLSSKELGCGVGAKIIQMSEKQHEEAFRDYPCAMAEKNPLHNVFPCTTLARPVCHRAIYHKSHLSNPVAAVMYWSWSNTHTEAGTSRVTTERLVKKLCYIYIYIKNSLQELWGVM